MASVSVVPAGTGETARACISDDMPGFAGVGCHGATIWLAAGEGAPVAGVDVVAGELAAHCCVACWRDASAPLSSVTSGGGAVAGAVVVVPVPAFTGEGASVSAFRMALSEPRLRSGAAAASVWLISCRMFAGVAGKVLARSRSVRRLVT